MRGFTIIETLIYIGLLAIIMSGVLTCIEAIQDSIERNTLLAHLDNEQIFLVEKLVYEVEHAQKIESPAINASSSELALIDQSGRSLSIKSDGGIIQATRKTSDSLPLLDTEFNAAISFYRGGMPASSTNPEYIDLSVVVSASDHSTSSVVGHAHRKIFLRTI